MTKLTATSANAPKKWRKHYSRSFHRIFGRFYYS